MTRTHTLRSAAVGCRLYHLTQRTSYSRCWCMYVLFLVVPLLLLLCRSRRCVRALSFHVCFYPRRRGGDHDVIYHRCCRCCCTQCYSLLVHVVGCEDFVWTVGTSRRVNAYLLAAICVSSECGGGCAIYRSPTSRGDPVSPLGGHGPAGLATPCSDLFPH